MFTKLFSSIVHSSIWLEDLETKVLWITMLALMDRQGCVYASAGGLARTAGLDPDTTRRILEKFQNPDPDSTDLLRAPGREGRRIEPIDGGWRLLNAKHYRAIRDAEERREQNRAAKERQRYRETTGDVSILSESYQMSATGSDGQQKSAPDQIRSEADQKQIKRERVRFAPPTLEEVRGYGREIPGLNAEAFFDFYASKGWKVGNAPMKDWKAAARRWRRTDEENGKIGTPSRSGTSLHNAEKEREAEEWAAKDQILRELNELREGKR